MRGRGPGFRAPTCSNADREPTLFKLEGRHPADPGVEHEDLHRAAALDELGPEATLPTVVLGAGQQEPDGTWRGDLYLRGGGDPTFGSAAFVRAQLRHRRDAPRTLADQIEGAGITRVTGRVYGDESRFDSLRGGPYSGFRTSIWVGPLSALSYNRGLANERGSSFQANPPAFAAARLDALLESRDISVRGKPAAGAAPDGRRASSRRSSRPRSPTSSGMTLKPSDNFFAEMLLKRIGGTPGHDPRRRPGRGHARARRSARGCGWPTGRGSRAATRRRRAAVGHAARGAA